MNFRQARRLPDVVIPGVDLAFVDALARLQLAARRAGCEIVVRGARPELLELIELAGLRGVLCEVGRKAEVLEQPGVEEVVVPDDPVP